MVLVNVVEGPIISKNVLPLHMRERNLQLHVRLNWLRWACGDNSECQHCVLVYGSDRYSNRYPTDTANGDEMKGIGRSILA